MSSVPQTVLDLVERFERNLEAYRSGPYNEAQVRREFIDPLFKALGWDVENVLGYAEAYKDVIHEDAIKIGGYTKAPDYCFRIGGARKFFVEAKKPAVRVKEEISPAYQLRRYAWSAKLPLSILTDFEEFAVYDCRVRPVVTDRASKARVLYVQYTDYAERWDEIATIFAKEAVLKGSFDKYAESTRRKRGTAEVDAAFLQEIDSWRDGLARNLAVRNPSLTPRELNYAVQRTIDRIIFLRICEDRGIEVYGRLLALLNGGQVYERLCDLYRQADERYNSGLFHFRHEKGRAEEPDELTPSLIIDDALLKGIIKSLYYPDSPYEFSVLPADILGQVYEQFLGKVIRLTAGHRAKVEYKPDVKKAGGVYYTPTYIVDYIVAHTVGELLVDSNPRKGAKLRILDPACGSGSFLLGAYQRLLDWHRDWYVADGPESWTARRNPRLYQGRGGEWRLTTGERKRILLNSIYGVDIDSQAVEVTKLSLLLKVLEGESGETLRRQLAFFRERALPDLATNIKCGNSLIGNDFYEGQQRSLFDEDEMYRINAFDWEGEFAEVMGAGGFDAVIGNPPYGAEYRDPEKAYLGSHYAHQSYQLDSYLVFLERSIRDLVSRGGLYGMIIPTPWLTNILQTKIRRYVTGNTHVVNITYFRFPVFRKATVHTGVVILRKTKAVGSRTLVRIFESLQAFAAPSSGVGLREIVHDQEQWQALEGGVINIFLSAKERASARKCREERLLLGSLYAINVGIKPYQVGKGKPPQTRRTVQHRPFDSDTPKDKTYRRYLRGSDIRRYIIAPVEDRFLGYGPWLAEPRPSADFDAPEKIFMRQTGDSLVAAPDRERLLCLNNMHVLVPKLPRPVPSYVLGLLNSRVLNWHYHTLNPQVGEALAEVKKTNVAALPIRTIDFSDPADAALHDRMVSLVERMLALQVQLAAAKTPTAKTTLQRQIVATDRQIDRLVYELYGLTEEEIGIVEGANG